MFGRVYAKFYNSIYQDKDYEAECDYLEEIFQKYSARKVSSILDIGCGTGGHMIPLLKREYDVWGVEPSSDMIEQAIKKGVDPIRIQNCTIQEREYQTLFDAAICMFSVLDYITETKDVITTLKNIRASLRHDGLFIADFWYGPAVLTVKPETRIKELRVSDLQVIRSVIPEWDRENNIIKSHYNMLVIEGDRVIDSVSEVHTLRYFFPQELDYWLKETGFEILGYSKFMDVDFGSPSENVWDATLVARAI